MNYTPAELEAVVLSRNLRDGWIAVTGVGSLIPMAACMLARLMHAPNLTLVSGGIYINPSRLPPLFLAGYDCAPAAVTDFDEVFRLSERGPDVVFYGGMQIDRWGNINLHSVGDPVSRRGPGIANTSFGNTAGRVFLFHARHEKRVFVEHVDFVTVLGQHCRGKARSALRVSSRGPELLVTPLAVFSLPVDGSAVPISRSPGVDWRDVRQRTGWSIAEDEVPETTSPSHDELRALRQVDPEGLLKRIA